MKAKEIAQMDIETLVKMHNETVDPFEWRLPYIMDNGEKALNLIAEKMGGAWLASAIVAGHFDPSALYIIAIEGDGTIETFSTPAEFFARFATPEQLAEVWY